MTSRIRTVLVSAAILGVAAIVTAVAVRKRLSSVPTEPSDVKPEWTATTLTDGQEIFRRAFWRRAAADDRILHAERTEWTDPGTGVAKWQWHLVVEPGQSLKEWLFEKNAFSLQPAATSAAIDSSPPSVKRPAWFPERLPEGRTIRNRTMTVTLSTADGRLYASDSGHGFTPGHRASVTTTAPATQSEGGR